MTCSTCRYWNAGNSYLDQTLDGEPTKGECRRRAPVGKSSDWPVTGWKDWCGEFEVSAPLRGKYEVEIGEGKMKVLGFKPATQPGSPDEQSGSQPPQDPSAPRQ